MPSLTATSTANRNLLFQIEELRAELASVTCPKERRQIQRELRAAKAQLELCRILGDGGGQAAR